MKKRLLGICMCAALLAQGGEHPDYSAAFESLWSLGLPEFTNAVPVKAVLSGKGPARRGYARSYYRGERVGIWPELPEVRNQPEATHWLIASNGLGAVTLMGAYGDVVRGYDEALAEKGAVGDELPRYVIRGCGVSNDLVRVESCLLKLLKNSGPSDGDLVSLSRDPFAFAGEELGFDGSHLLFSLAALHQAGCGSQAEVSRLTGMLFTLAGGPEKVVAGTVNRVAAHQYAALADELRQGRVDLKGFAAQLDLLLARFGEHWLAAGAVREIRDDAAQSASVSTPPLIQGLSAEQQRTADALVSEIAYTNELESSIYQYCSARNHNWLFDAERAAPATGRSVLLRIVAGGVQSIPVLVAMCDDRTMSGLFLSGAETAYEMRFDMRRDEGDSSEVRSSMRRFLSRPLTRGEIAEAMLKAVLPESADSEDDPFISPASESGAEPQTIKERALAFYEQNRNSSLADIAWSQLIDDGSSGGDALTYLACQAERDPQLAERLEKQLLKGAGEASGARDSYTLFNRWTLYCRIRGGAASNFVHQAGAELKIEEGREETEDKAAAESMYSAKGRRHADREKRYIAEGYKRLKELTGIHVEKKERSFQAILDEWCKRKPDESKYEYSDQIRREIFRLIQGGTDIDTLYSAALDQSLSSKDLNVTGRLLELMSFLWSAGEMVERGDISRGRSSEYKPYLESLLNRPEGETVAEEDQGEAQPLYQFVKHAGKWNQLLSDTRMLPGESAGRLCDSAAAIICSGFSYEDLSLVYELSEERTRRWLSKGAAHLLAGKPAGDFQWPDIEELTEADVAGLAARMKKLKPDEIGPFLDTEISDSEYLGIPVVLDSDNSLTALLAPYAAVIRRVSIAANLPAALSSMLRQLEGERVSVDLLKALHGKILAVDEPGAGRGAMVRFNRAENLGGWSVAAGGVEEAENYSLKSRMEEDDGVEEIRKNKILYLQYRVSGYDTILFRWNKEGTMEMTDEEEFAGIQGETQRSPWEILEKIFTGSGDEEDPLLSDEFGFCVVIP